MNWQIKKKRVKQVNVSFEWTEKSDLKLILDDLMHLISSGVESYYLQKKSVEIENKYHLIEFTQKYPDSIHESIEREINGELNLVIKSNF
jgi:hypothetical protein